MAELVEFRKDTDDQYYTKEQFEEYYAGTQAWDAAIESRIMKKCVVPETGSHKKSNRNSRNKSKRRRSGNAIRSQSASG